MFNGIDIYIGGEIVFRGFITFPRGSRNLMRHGLRIQPLLLLAPCLFQPLLVRNRVARRHLPYPRAVSRLSKVHRNVELARQHRQSADVIGVLMRDQNCIQIVCTLAHSRHAPHQFAAGQTCVHQNTGMRRRNDGAVALGP